MGVGRPTDPRPRSPHVPDSSPQPARFVLTGPTGWVGRALLELLMRPDDPDRLGDGATVTLFGSRTGEVVLGDGRRLPVRPLAEIAAADVEGAHVVHLSFLTKDKIEPYGEAEFTRVNTQIDDHVLDACAGGRPASVFVASSGAARDAQGEASEGADAYARAKYRQEQRFLAFASEHRVPVICGRIFNIAGPHINKLENYALSNLAVQALRGEPMKIAADIPVFRSYLHVDDLCRIIVRSARAGVAFMQPIDLCGPQITEISEIAREIMVTLPGQVSIERPVLSYGRVSDYVGRSQETLVLASMCGLSLRSLQDQVRDTIAYIASTELSGGMDAKAEPKTA